MLNRNVSTFICLVLILLGFSCSSNSGAPDSYGIYINNNKKALQQIEIRFTSLFYLLPNVKDLVRIPPLKTLVIWVFDPKIIPTNIRVVRLQNKKEDLQPIDIKVKPVKNQAGLVKVEVASKLPSGIYAVFAEGMEYDNIWPFIICEPSKAKLAERIIGVWMKDIDKSTMVFTKDGIIGIGGSTDGQSYTIGGYYSIRNQDTLDIKRSDVGAGIPYPIYFANDSLLFLNEVGKQTVLRKLK